MKDKERIPEGIQDVEFKRDGYVFIELVNNAKWVTLGVGKKPSFHTQSLTSP